MYSQSFGFFKLRWTAVVRVVLICFVGTRLNLCVRVCFVFLVCLPMFGWAGGCCWAQRVRKKKLQRLFKLGVSKVMKERAMEMNRMAKLASLYALDAFAGRWERINSNILLEHRFFEICRIKEWRNTVYCERLSGAEYIASKKLQYSRQRVHSNLGHKITFFQLSW